MVKTYTPPDDRKVVCPSCGAEIKTPPSPRSRRVQCPKCREVVVIESLPEPEGGKKPRAVAAPEAAKDHSRIEALEARVAALEAAQACMGAAKPGPEKVTDRKKLQWVPSTTDRAREFSPERGRALAHNLGTVKVREITIRIPASDLIAGEHAIWFKEVFERAGWAVRGPVEVAPGAASKALELAVPELPVAQEAAETYLALKAAGFEPVPVLDPALASGSEATTLSLTLPAEAMA
jgi:hypothetical protein